MNAPDRVVVPASTSRAPVWRILLRSVALTLCLAASAHAAQPKSGAPPSIPELAWEVRSDWIDVTKAVTPGAKGDGVADDTAAIQAAIELTKNGAISGATIYFPPGKYRITKTLEMSDPPPFGQHLGFSMIGHGRSSILIWDGADDGRMFWTRHGMPLCRYVGLTWDGRGKAAVGFEHASIKYFETEVRHQHEAYRNFRVAGIRVGNETKIATAETVYDNCLFENCGAGIALMSHNVLDHTMRGCEFRGCDRGITAIAGTNFYAERCHFENSKQHDIRSHGEAGSSIRWCTSQGSQQFVIHWAAVAPLVIQDCHVDAWKDPAYAVLQGGAPMLMFDCVFTNPPSTQAPLDVTKDLRNGHVFLSNNKAEGAAEFITRADHPHRVANTFHIPISKHGGVVQSASQSFLRSTVRIPGKVFDAKRDFGAKADQVTDDTKAIQATIDAARAHGKDAIAYMPSGHYLVSETITVTGSDYFVGGSGYQSVLGWQKGKKGGTLLEVRDANRVTIENLSVTEESNSNDPENDIDILHVGTGKPTFVTYDRVQVYGIYKSKPLEQGIHFRNLGKADQVLINEVEGKASRQNNLIN